MEQIIQYVNREISELKNAQSYTYLRNLGAPKLINYYESNGEYAHNKCWLITRAVPLQLYLCVIEIKSARTKSWGYLERRNNKYIWIAYGAYDFLEHALIDFEQLLLEMND